MKIQKFLITIFAVAAALCSCEKEPAGGSQLPSDIKTDLKFTVEMSELTYNYARIKVQHNGTTSDTWYGFLTDQVDKIDAMLIADKLAELGSKGEIKGLEKRTSKTVELNDLDKLTEYKYIVFAITPDGELYGEYKSFEFTTPEGYLLQKVEDWDIAYDGRTDNQELYTINFAKNAPRCHVGFIDKWMVDYYESVPEIQDEIKEYGGLRLQIGESVFLFSVLDYLVWEELYEYWGYYDGDSAYFNAETLGESSTIKIPRQPSGEYYVVAIGFEDCVPTLTYSAELVEIVKETPSENYNRWMGTWNITGANNISYKLRFEENDPNFSYYVYGWECSDSIHESTCDENCKEHLLYTDFSEYELGIPIYFDAFTNELVFYSELLKGERASDDSFSYWGLYGYTEYEGETVSILMNDDKIASAALPVDSRSILNGLESMTYNYDSAGNATEVVFTYKSLGYVMYNDKTYAPVAWNVPLELPATIVKSEEEAVASAAYSQMSTRNAVRKANAVSTFNNIKKADYSKLKKADFLNR